MENLKKGIAITFLVLVTIGALPSGIQCQDIISVVIGIITAILAVIVFLQKPKKNNKKTEIKPQNNEIVKIQYAKSGEQLKITQKQLNNSVNKVVIPSNSSLTADSQIHLQKIVVQILTKSITRKMGIGVTFETTDEEDAFFRELVKQTIEAKLNPDLFYFEPMSDKSFSVQYQNYPIGKIKLTGRKTHMQILKGLYEIKSFDNLPLQEYILHIPEWIKHIQFCLK